MDRKMTEPITGLFWGYFLWTSYVDDTLKLTANASYYSSKVAQKSIFIP